MKLKHRHELGDSNVLVEIPIIGNESEFLKTAVLTLDYVQPGKNEIFPKGRHTQFSQNLFLWLQLLFVPFTES